MNAANFHILSITVYQRAKSYFGAKLSKTSIEFIEFSFKVSLHSMFFDFKKYLKSTEIDQF
jgi:hypothetical protein